MSRTGLVILILILVLGAGLRLYRLDAESLWHDEIFTVYSAQLSWDRMMDALLVDRVHPPLHYVLLKGWFAAVGFGGYQARLLSALFGLLAIGAAFLFARALFGARLGLAAAFLLSISQPALLYSQEARSYSQLTFLYLIAGWLLLKNVSEPRRLLWWMAFTLTSLALVYTHYYGAFAFASLLLGRLLCFRGVRVNWRWLAGSVIMTVLLFLPWLLSGAFEGGAAFRGASSLQVKWFSVPSSLNWFHGMKWQGKGSPSPIPLVAMGFLVFAAPWIWALSTKSLRSGACESVRKALFVLTLALCPVVLAVATGYFGIRYSVRHTIFCCGPYLVLVAWGWANLPGRRLPFTVGSLVVVLSLIGVGAAYSNFRKPDYRAAVSWISSEARAGDCWILTGESRLLTREALWTIYGRDVGLPRIPDEEPLDSGACKRLWFHWDRWRSRTEDSVELFDALERVRPLLERREFYLQQVILLGPHSAGPS